MTLDIATPTAEIDLREFGYAPGYYGGGTCLRCSGPLENVDKRAMRCKACAMAMHEAKRAAASMAVASIELAPQPDTTVPAELAFRYKNYRGEISTRRVQVLSLAWNKSQWHPEPQWLMTAIDLDKMERRDFAVQDMAPLGVSDAWFAPTPQLVTRGVTEEVRALIERSLSAINAAYSQAQAEYQNHDHIADRHDKVVRAYRRDARAVLSATNPTTPERDVEAIRAHVMQEREACARIAEEACLVLPDGGSPTEEECEVAAEAARRIRARSTRASVLSVLRCADDVLAHQPKGAE